MLRSLPDPAGVVAMLTLYSWPELFGVADNNPYGLKTYAFLKLCRVPFRHEHLLDATQAPHGQLPYIADDDRIIVSEATAPYPGCLTLSRFLQWPSATA